MSVGQSIGKSAGSLMGKRGFKSWHRISLLLLRRDLYLGSSMEKQTTGKPPFTRHRSGVIEGKKTTGKPPFKALFYLAF
ncbi:hypothetical protein FNV43_RR05029 [Rhamnella rubrinervis]|uniref:Uncharacterized protein n=1 Tax=Rhamnella rubrinervis TaxID=2594499 RepID=A0A8K0MQ40_9ROSA|nr:hypothetical protein FNV43_RR05029 [Rhamnella rubrinervis]